jgi:hypothetical protein
MEFEITPEPTEAERAAIAKALAEEAAEKPRSAWLAEILTNSSQDAA